MATETKASNRLINEKSPYLLQHAHNPVEWYPWGEEALAKARAEDKPIFLSIGYSTCHWCHVMERESFEKDDVAEVLNQHFVAIKVDREERPDLDHIYMGVCQLMTGQGGWPLNVVLTPDRKPLFAGTYFPHQDRLGAPGLIRILKTIAELWRNDRRQLLDSSDAIMEELQKGDTPAGETNLGPETLEMAFRMYERIFDRKWGGFGHAPKFPTPHNLVFLLRYGRLTDNVDAVAMATETLDRMYQGGIYDHIGGGFARYSTDERWLVPHFEKMLYDNALLALAYLEAFQVTGEPWYAGVAREIFTYLQREMTSPEGGFYSAQDADSEGEEGLFYLWTPEQVNAVLGDEAGQAFCDYYDIKPGGNFEGKSIPNLIKSGIGTEEDWAAARQQLYEVRLQRIPPFKDDKILTSWNGLTIAAFALGYRLLGEEEYRLAAEKAANFVLTRLRRDDGRLLARYRDGEASFLAYLDDYAFLTWGLTELYQATFSVEWLREALTLSRQMLESFKGEDGEGLYYTGNDAETQIMRPREIYDGATPSGNSVAALNLIRLARITGDNGLEEKAVGIIETFSSQVTAYPLGYSQLLQAVAWLHFPGRELVLAGQGDEANWDDMLETARELAGLQTVLVGYRPGDDELEELAPYLRGYHTVDGKAAAYLCENHACQQPLIDSNRLREALQALGLS